MIHCTSISDPPQLTADDITRIDDESKRLSDAFHAHTKSMEILTSDDLRTCIRGLGRKTP